MKHDECPFFNQQLAGMLRAGIPLEGEVRRLCSTMRRGRLKDEFQKLEADLSQGIPLDQALVPRRMPDFYKHMLRVGVRGGNLPGVLTLVADYYQRSSHLWTRLTGLMIYPALVLAAGIAVSVFLSMIYGNVWQNAIFATRRLGTQSDASLTHKKVRLSLMLPVVTLCLLGLAFALALTLPKVRQFLRWRLPGFKEASLFNFAESLRMMLQHGGNLDDSLALLENLENKSPLGEEVSRWRTSLAAGQTKIADLAAQSRVIPPLF